MEGASEMRGGFLRCAAAATCVLAAGLATAGCGGDSDGAGPGQASPRYSVANEPPRSFAERMAKLIETTATPGECGELNEISGRSLTRFSCPADKSFRRSMERFEVAGAEEYGTGAVVDYTSAKAKDGAAILLFVAPDRNWAVSRMGIATEPSTDTSDEGSRPGFRSALDAYLAAIRDRDCRAFAAVAFTGEDGTAEVCRKIFPGTLGLTKRLKANPSARPRYQGGNATYGFFTLETGKPVPANITLSVAREPGSPESYLVLDGAPSPTGAQQRQALEDLKRSRRDGAPETSPSRKADGP